MISYSIENAIVFSVFILYLAIKVLSLHVEPKKLVEIRTNIIKNDFIRLPVFVAGPF